jgi:hypothetical protein
MSLEIIEFPFRFPFPLRIFRRPPWPPDRNLNGSHAKSNAKNFWLNCADNTFRRASVTIGKAREKENLREMQIPVQVVEN